MNHDFAGVLTWQAAVYFMAVAVVYGLYIRSTARRFKLKLPFTAAALLALTMTVICDRQLGWLDRLARLADLPELASAIGLAMLLQIVLTVPLLTWGRTRLGQNLLPALRLTLLTFPVWYGLLLTGHFLNQKYHFW